MAELLWQPALGSAEIGVSVKNGVVMLSGIVDSYYKKLLAEKAAKRVSSVNAVAEEIIVKVPGTQKRTDVDIAEAVIHALAWDSTVDEKKVRVMVEDGIVTLEGEVEWYLERESAYKAIQKLVGIKRIINNIRVRTKIAPGDVEKNIFLAFHRSATIDSKKVNVEVAGDKVTLRGTVRSFSEKNDAEKTAWATPGVASVENHLVIDSNLEIK